MSKLKLLFAAAVALVAFAALTASASAFRATIAAGGNISSASLGKITFGTSPTIQCSLTLNGTLKTSAELTAGETLGSINEVRIAACSGGEVEEVLSLPWPVTVKSVPSGLPDSATSLAVNLKRTAFLLSTFFNIVNCLYGEEGTRIAGGTLGLTDTGTNRYTTGLLRADETVQLRKVSGSGSCPAEGGFRGTFGLSPTQSITVS
jgi:hypothetical protein